ncbi:hypothetical protein BDW68DRAFT_65718 [Aspergillus falconensis]
MVPFCFFFGSSSGLRLIHQPPEGIMLVLWSFGLLPCFRELYSMRIFSFPFSSLLSGWLALRFRRSPGSRLYPDFTSLNSSSDCHEEVRRTVIWSVEPRHRILGARTCRFIAKVSATPCPIKDTHAAKAQTRCLPSSCTVDHGAPTIFVHRIDNMDYGSFSPSTWIGCYGLDCSGTVPSRPSALILVL